MKNKILVNRFIGVIIYMIVFFLVQLFVFKESLLQNLGASLLAAAVFFFVMNIFMDRRKK